MTIDLKQGEGRARFLDLCRTADAVLEGFRPGVVQRLGVGPDDVQHVNPQAVYVSISGFGQCGPYARRPAHDIVYQAVAGLLHDQVTRRDGRGEPPVVPWADIAGGSFAAIAVLTGLLNRARTGAAPSIDLGIAEATATLMAPLIASASIGGRLGIPASPAYGIYWTLDGTPVALGVVHEDHLWDDLCRAIGRQDLAGIPAAGRWDDQAFLDGEVRRAIGEWTWENLEEALEAGNVAFARVNRLDEVPGDPHLAARGLVQPGTPAVVHQPLRFDGAHPRVDNVSVPGLGEHNADFRRPERATPASPSRPQ